MDGYLRQATAAQSRLLGPFVDDVDFKTAKTALTIANTDIKLRANGTSLTTKNSGGGTHEVNGMYSVTWDATDTANVGELKYSVVVAGALQVFGSYVVLEEAVYDALFAASAPGYGTAQSGDAFARLGAPAGASVSADVAAVKTQTAAIETDTQDLQGRLPAALTGAGNIKADALVVSDKTGYALSAAAVDAILDDPITEPAGVFAWGSATLRNIIGWLGAMASNRITETATTQTVRNRANSATLASSTVSDDGTTATRDSFT